MSRNFQGYIREQIVFNCRLNTMELEAISSKGTGSICSACGSEGKREKAEFICEACGCHSTVAVNSARNIEWIVKCREKLAAEECETDSDRAEKKGN